TRSNGSGRSTGSSTRTRMGSWRSLGIMAFLCWMRRAILCPEESGRHGPRGRTQGRRRLGALILGLSLALFCFSLTPAFADPPAVRVAALSFGSVDWELEVVRRNSLDQAHGFKLVTLKLADKDAASLALVSNSVDLIVTDWFWVSHQRAKGGDPT